MRTAIPFFLCGAVLVGCTKPEDQMAPVVNSCGSDGQRIEISVDNNGWCANASVSAMASPDGQALISGLALNGQMFTLAIDSMAIGTFIIDDMDNITTWTEVGNAFTAMADHPGELVITAYDASTHRLTGTVDVVLHDAESLGSRHLTGGFDVTCMVQ